MRPSNRGTQTRRQINITFSQKEYPILDSLMDKAEDASVPYSTLIKDHLGLLNALMDRGVDSRNQRKMLLLKAFARVLNTDNGMGDMEEFIRTNWPGCWDKEDRLSEQLN